MDQNLQIDSDHNDENYCKENVECSTQIDLNESNKIKCSPDYKLLQCPKCGINQPQWVLDCHHNFCMICSAEIYGIYYDFCKDRSYDVYSKFMDRMRDLFNEKNKESANTI